MCNTSNKNHCPSRCQSSQDKSKNMNQYHNLCKCKRKKMHQYTNLHRSKRKNERKNKCQEQVQEQEQPKLAGVIGRNSLSPILPKKRRVGRALEEKSPTASKPVREKAKGSTKKSLKLQDKKTSTFHKIDEMNVANTVFEVVGPIQ